MCPKYLSSHSSKGRADSGGGEFEAGQLGAGGRVLQKRDAQGRENCRGGGVSLWCLCVPTPTCSAVGDVLRLTWALLRTEQFADPESVEAPPASPAWRNFMNTALNRDAPEGRPRRGATPPLRAAPGPSPVGSETDPKRISSIRRTQLMARERKIL